MLFKISETEFNCQTVSRFTLNTDHQTSARVMNMYKSWFLLFLMVFFFLKKLSRQKNNDFSTLSNNNPYSDY